MNKPLQQALTTYLKPLHDALTEILSSPNKSHISRRLSKILKKISRQAYRLQWQLSSPTGDIIRKYLSNKLEPFLVIICDECERWKSNTIDKKLFSMLGNLICNYPDLLSVESYKKSSIVDLLLNRLDWYTNEIMEFEEQSLTMELEIMIVDLVGALVDIPISGVDSKNGFYLSSLDSDKKDVSDGSDGGSLDEYLQLKHHDIASKIYQFLQKYPNYELEQPDLELGKDNYKYDSNNNIRSQVIFSLCFTFILCIDFLNDDFVNVENLVFGDHDHSCDDNNHNNNEDYDCDCYQLLCHEYLDYVGNGNNVFTRGKTFTSHGKDL